MTKDFLTQLQSQAEKQAVLNQKRIIPRQFDVITSFIGNYPWQSILFLSIVSAILIAFL